MKIALNQRPVDGPWGGGNRFVAALCNGLRAAGHNVVYELQDNDIDIAIIIDPRVMSPNVTFGPGALFRHITFRSPKTIVMHRINECDERKGKAFINRKLVRANYVADATCFVGAWLKDLPVWRANARAPHFVIHNGADTSVFHTGRYIPWDGSGPLKLVTHHWGYHPNKGFDIYRLLDDMLGNPAWRDRIRFTYIGNLPAGFSFQNAEYVEPLDGPRLAEELSKHQVYVTGSINEPGGNHQNEGALCGLPLIYRNSGCMPEYCGGFGIQFEGVSDFEQQLKVMLQNYPKLVAKMPTYPNTSAKMVVEWIALLEHLAAQCDEIIAQRKRTRNARRSLQLLVHP